MTLALEEARRAADRGEVPVGAVLTRGEVVLAHGGNAQIELHDVTAHAEIRVLREAGVRDSNYRLPGTTLYVTLDPARCVAAHWFTLESGASYLPLGSPEPGPSLAPVGYSTTLH